MSQSQSFCVPLSKLHPAAIAELQKVHPDALPISMEWRLRGGFSPDGEQGQVVIWWVPSSEPTKREAAKKAREAREAKRKAKVRGE